MKKGKEIKLESFKDYNVVYGSVNNKNPNALYVSISAWAEPVSDSQVNYNRVIRDIDKKIRQTIYDFLSEDILKIFIKENTIVDFDIKESGVRYGKRSFTSCEITLFFRNELPIQSEHVKDYVDILIGKILEKTLESNKHFEFHKRKK